MFSKSSFLCSWNLSFQWVQLQPKPRRQTSKMSPNLHAPVHLYKHTLCCVTLRSSQRARLGKNVTCTGGMTVGNKQGPPVYLDNDLLRIRLLSHVLGVSPSRHSPTSVTVHPALPMILFMSFFTTKKNYLVVPTTVKIMQPWEICCKSSHLSLYFFTKPIKTAVSYHITPNSNERPYLSSVILPNPKKKHHFYGLMKNWSFHGFIDLRERMLR